MGPFSGQFRKRMANETVGRSNERAANQRAPPDQGATRGLNRQLLHDGAIRRATVSAVASPRPQGRSSTSPQQRGTLTSFAHYAGGITLAPGVTCLIVAGTSASTFPNAQPSPPSTICWNLGLLHTSSR